MNSMRLVQLSTNDGKDVYGMLQRIERWENDFNNETKDMTFKEFKQWLLKMDQWSKGEALPEGYVRQWIYWLIVNDIPIGIGKLREKTTTESLKWGGNIGFAIEASERGKGYGTCLFQLLLNKASHIGIEDIISTVMSTNIPSRKVHEKLGGELTNEHDGIVYYHFSL